MVPRPGGNAGVEKGWWGGRGFELHGLFCLGLSFSTYKMGADHLHDLLP